MTLFISICIATYKRPESLARLLEGIHNLEFHKNHPPLIEVLIADNDSEKSAKQVYEGLKNKFKWSLIYENEPQKGVTYARNKSVAMASNKANFLVFIDDDEVPTTLWLDELLAAQASHAADIVAGPVLPKFEAKDVPYWITEGGFFAPPKYSTGEILNVAFTNNALVKADFIRKLDVPFDSRFAIKGAEDTFFFMQLRKLGASIIWSQAAIVYEFIPSHRTTLPWLLERSFWGWSSYSLFEKELYPCFKIQGVRLIKGISLIIIGLTTILPALFLRKHKLYKSILNIYRGMGTLSGLLGIQGSW